MGKCLLIYAYTKLITTRLLNKSNFYVYFMNYWYPSYLDTREFHLGQNISLRKWGIACLVSIIYNI